MTLTNKKSCISYKFIKKWMRLAKHIALDNDTPCSRKVGSVVVDKDNIVLGIGYNGMSRNVPHCDSAEYIKDFLIPRLNQEELNKLATKAYFGETTAFESVHNELIPVRLDGCGQCPRRILGYSSGKRTDLCDCQHAERNVISNARGGVAGGVLFNWSCVSCRGCTGALINARIAEVHFLAGPEYESGCLKAYEYANIPVFLYEEGEINEH